MQKKKELNIVYSKYYYKLFTENQNKRYYNKSERINDCLNLWQWDVYHQNKVMDLQKVNRCMDNRFCPNCRKFSLASAIHNFSPTFKAMLHEGYKPYLLTLTVPNCTAEELKATIERMNKSFRKLFQALNIEIGQGRHGFSERLIELSGALKVLEITYNPITNTFHPHFHCIVFSLDYDQQLFEKKIEGAYSRKRKQVDYNSLMDIHIMQLWKMCYDGIRMTVKNYESMSSNWYDLYLCDIKEMDVNGIYEVMKYTFKDSDINNYYVFKTLYCALEGKRIRQGYGLLYNLKLEEETEGEMQSLEDYLKIKETPEQLLTQELNQLTTVYKDYLKISRFKAHSELNNIIE